MRTHRIHFCMLQLVVGLIGATAALSSCTVLLPIFAESTKPIKAEKAGFPAGRVKQGQRIVLHLADSTVVRGRLYDVRMAERVDVLDWYETTLVPWAKSMGLDLRLGEPVELQLRSGETLTGAMLGVERTAITLSAAGQQRRFAADDWVSLKTPGGGQITSQRFTSALRTSAHPSTLRIFVAGESGEIVDVDAAWVERTTVYPFSHRKTGKYLAVGAALDLAGLAAYAIFESGLVVLLLFPIWAG